MGLADYGKQVEQAKLAERQVELLGEVLAELRSIRAAVGGVVPEQEAPELSGAMRLGMRIGRNKG